MKRWMGKGLLKRYHSASDYLLQMHGFSEGMEPILPGAHKKSYFRFGFIPPCRHVVVSLSAPVNMLSIHWSKHSPIIQRNCQPQTPHNEMSLLQGGKLKFKTRLQFCYC